MQRTWVVRPRDGELTVARQDVLEAIEDAEAVQWRMGGHVLIAHQRVRADELLVDGLPGEAFTTAVVVQWRNRTDARANPEQTVPLGTQPEEPQEAPEEAAQAPPAPDPAPDPSAPRAAAQEADLPPLRRPDVAVAAAQAVQPVDGEDTSAIPPGVLA